MGLLDRLGVKDQLRSIAVPHVRSSSARIMLNITQDMGLALARKKKNIVTAFKTMAPVSKIPGSDDGAKLWTTPRRSPEKAKIRAIVSVKSIFTTTSQGEPSKSQCRNRLARKLW